MLHMSTVGGAAAPRAVWRAAQDTTGGGGAEGGLSNPRGGVEAGDAEDGTERVPGEGKRWK